MRRLLSVFTIICLLITLLMLFNMRAFGEDSLWDGSVAEGFAGGSGKKYDPYRISSAEQLAYFAALVNEGKNFREEYIILTCDITLNDERFSYDSEGDYVTISDGKNEAKIKRQALLAGDTIDYNGKLHLWTPIDSDGKKTFCGTFDGDGHTVYGLCAIQPGGRYVGLFGNTGGHIYNLNIENALCAGEDYVGSLGGSMNSYDSYGQSNSLLFNIQTNAVVLSNKTAAGVAAQANGTYCCFEGIVHAGTTGAGVFVFSDVITDYCKASGNIIGKDAAGVCYYGAVSHCESSANISAEQRAGGISYSGKASYCHNTGTVRGASPIGGITATGYASHCHNAGTVIGENYVGGINGSGDSDFCTNAGDVWGKNYVGGIAGSGKTYVSSNSGNINGFSHVGGICGISSTPQNHFIYECCNIGNVYANDTAGGIVGLGENCYISRSYNTGDISCSMDLAGGIAGKAAEVSTCYNIGSVTGRNSVGAIAGDITERAERCYYIPGCADAGIGVKTSENEAIHQNCLQVSREDLCDPKTVKLDSYAGFEYEKTEGYPYPTLRSMHHGEHRYGSRVINTQFGITEISCNIRLRVSYTKCDCGMISPFTVEHIPAKHVFEAGFAMIDDQYHRAYCTICGAMDTKNVEHIFNDDSEIVFDSQYHYKKCLFCDAHYGRIAHQYTEPIKNSFDEQVHYLRCADCGTAPMPFPHTFEGLAHDDGENGHRIQCVLCAALSKSHPHEFGNTVTFGDEWGHYTACRYCRHFSPPIAHHLGKGTQSKETVRHRCAECGTLIALPFSPNDTSIPIHLIVLYCIVGTVTGGLLTYGAVILRDMRKTRIKNKK
ncbi:MAG: hypothetical protein E7616_01000 [Ruminococcaceae bacterium]|nr:hypothetical protein [Oscillospiraceae bacterium]